MENAQQWPEKIQEKRIAYGLSQDAVASSIGITRSYYSKIETGCRIVSDDMKVLIENMLEKLNPDLPLEFLFDYVRLRFPTKDVQHVVESVLKIRFSRMFAEEYGFYGYAGHYRFGDIVVMVSDLEDEERGTLLELKGRGCRQFEGFLEAQRRNWYDFFTDAMAENCVFKRIDLAINDKKGILNIPALTKKCEQEECISIFRSFSGHKSGDFTRSEKVDDKYLGMGNTLYVGSLSSDIYFCVYEKDYEQYKKEGIPIEDAEVKNRFELRLKNDRANNAVVDLLVHQDPEKTVMEIINRYIRFVDRVEGKDPKDWPLNKSWLLFLGEGRGQLKLTMKPEPYEIQRTIQWLAHQVAPTLRLVATMDVLRNTDTVNDMVKDSRLSRRHKKLLEQMSIPLQDVIIPSFEWQDTTILRKLELQKKEAELDELLAEQRIAAKQKRLYEQATMTGYDEIVQPDNKG